MENQNAQAEPQASTSNEPSGSIEPQTAGAADGTAEDTPGMRPVMGTDALAYSMCNV